jgi:hypothetical protein
MTIRNIVMQKHTIYLGKFKQISFQNSLKLCYSDGKKHGLSHKTKNTDTYKISILRNW